MVLLMHGMTVTTAIVIVFKNAKQKTKGRRFIIAAD
jgi:hypothetical protein